MMTSQPDATPITGELYQEVQHFYARHMQLLDEGEIEQWAAGFTEDGVFATNARPAPSRGRALIAANTGKARESLLAEGVQRRHWLGMLQVDPGATPGELRTRSYALIVSTQKGGSPIVHLSTTCEDILVSTPTGWLIRERRVSRDDLP